MFWLHKVSPIFLIKQLYHQSCSRIANLSFWILGYGQNWKKKDKREREPIIFETMGLFKILPEKSWLLQHLAFRSDRLNFCVKLSLSASKGWQQQNTKKEISQDLILRKIQEELDELFNYTKTNHWKQSPSIIHRQTKQQCKCKSHQSYKCHVSTSETKLSLEQAFYWLQKSRPMTISHSNLHYMLWKKGSNKK